MDILVVFIDLVVVCAGLFHEHTVVNVLLLLNWVDGSSTFRFREW